MALGVVAMLTAVQDVEALMARRRPQGGLEPVDAALDVQAPFLQRRSQRGG